MIAHQETNIAERFFGLHRRVDDAGAVRASINQIAQKDDFAFNRTAFAIILHDLVQQLLQKVIATVDIANSIDPPSVGDGRAVNRPNVIFFA